MITPPASWRVIAYCVSPGIRMKPTAPTFTRSDISFETWASSPGEASRRTYSVQMLRVKRFAAAIDMTDAGTSAPIAIEARANPANHVGNANWMSCGTALFAP